MKRVIVNESAFQRLCAKVIKENLEQDYNPIADGNAGHNPYRRQIEMSQDKLASFLLNNGLRMTSIENGKEYIVFELTQLGSLMGTRYCFCQLIKDNKPFGALYLKPFKNFKMQY